MATEKDREFAERLRSFRQSSALSQQALGEKLGVSGDYIYQLEAGMKTPGGPLEVLFNLLETSPIYGSARPPNTPASPDRLAPGQFVLADCDDPRAFAVGVSYDSMSPTLVPGDIVILSPGMEVRHGDIVGVRHPNHGEMIRILNFEGGNLIRLSALNPAWRDLVDDRKSFEYIHRAHSLVRVFDRSRGAEPVPSSLSQYQKL